MNDHVEQFDSLTNSWPRDFDSRRNENPYKYGINETVVFELVVHNEVAGYDPNTGHFMAPEVGVYMFVLQYSTLLSNPDHFQIVKEGRELTKSLQSTCEWCLSVRAFALLALGDKVWVKSTSKDDHRYEATKSGCDQRLRNIITPMMTSVETVSMEVTLGCK
ncbi:hypothetical protein DPMN_133766 [Dreissena polymorpha]|uniref:C1q domain-containing protein n=1 Tax=Dreissena polymorpha TaxID=45954 RepID=A0A9D4FUZ0_DREPO|nr:hypothetical protein DPMN_133766 [Dreissena polymorpha]